MASEQDKSTVTSSATPSGSDLFGRTVRTVVILVGACVLFVGGLSAAAVAITSKAVSTPPSAQRPQEAPPAAPEAPNKISRPRADGTAI